MKPTGNFTEIAENGNICMKQGMGFQIYLDTETGEVNYTEKASPASWTVFEPPTVDITADAREQMYRLSEAELKDLPDYTWFIPKCIEAAASQYLNA